MDVTTAFLHPQIDQDDIFMNLPELDNLGDLSEFGITSTHTVRLRKALYGLKQAPRLWHQEIDGFLKSIGLIQSTVEPNLYLSSNVLLLLNVDDIVLLYRSLEDLNIISEKLKGKYHMTDLGPIKRFLGLNIEMHGTGYTLSQTTYIDNMLKKYGMQDAYNVDSPIDCNVDLEIKKDDKDRPNDQKEYLAIVRSLMFAALGGRPDISYAVNLLSRYNINPRTRHLSTAKRILRYLKKTKNLKLIYTGSKPEYAELHGFVDADWANSEDRKSVGGYVFLFGGAAISWSSKKQSLVALSTEEAEYTAFTEASRETLWLHQILLDIENRGLGNHWQPENKSTTLIYADNQAAIKHAATEGITARTKHFDIRLQHSRNLQHKGVLKFAYVKSSRNTADIFTKGLPAPTHQRHVKNLGLGTDCLDDCLDNSG